MKKNSSHKQFLHKIACCFRIFPIVGVLWAVWAGAPMHALAQSADKTVTIHAENQTVRNLLQEIQKQTGINFAYNEKMLSSYTSKSLDVTGQSVAKTLQVLFEGTDLTYSIDGNTVTIYRKPQNQTAGHNKVKGKVTDEQGEPLPGVAVLIAGTTIGTVSDMEGNYTLDIPANVEGKLRFSMVGMEMQEVAVGSRTVINVILRQANTEMEEVVVTGIFNKSRESYTGAVTTVTEKELKMFKGQNLLSTLKNIDPAFNIVSNNALGSNPNAIPEINIRGNSSLPMSMDELNTSAAHQLNAPLIIMDGFEISLEKLMDFNDEEIAGINIMKDAAATAIYGSRGANGVVVITTKAPEAGRMKVFAQAGISLEMPDLSSYNLLNSRDKLALEKEAGMYDPKDGDPHATQELEEKYYATLSEILKGVDTYWLSEPLRVGVGQKYNLRLEGGNNEFRWGASVAYNSIKGAMKGSERNTFSGAVTLSYNYKNVIFRNQTNLDYNTSSESKYGNFSDYAQMNPYWRTHNEEGELIQTYTTIFGKTKGNPLYDASLNIVDKSKYNRMTNNFSIEWDIIQGLKLKGMVGISKENRSSDHFLPAEHSSFHEARGWDEAENYFRRGSYDYTTREQTDLESRITLSYATTFAKKHQLYAGFDWSLRQGKMQSYSFKAEGFANQDYDFLANALQYAKDGRPDGSEDISRQVGFTGNLNYTYDNRYYADFSFRMDGSSQFGSKNKFAPFWSAGIGWNLHREHFLAGHSVINNLRIRASYGKTGSQQFSAYQALQSFQYNLSKRYLIWSGADLMGLGNEHLKWQTTDQIDGGIEIGLWNNRLSASFDIYQKKTSNLLSQMDLPHANGFASYTDNVGEVKNNGFEASLSGYAVRNTEKGIIWMLTGKLAYTKNEITKLSDAIKAQSELYLKNNTDADNMLFEGHSQYAIYAVPSLGIDPSTGKELFLDANGEVTTEWNPSAKVYYGQTEPKFRGNISSLLTWRDLTLNLSFGFRWGGQQYNETLLNKVEVTTSQMEYNVDKRVFTDRWQKPGDLKPFKGYGDYRTDKSSRFVMDEKVFEMQSASLQYRWHGNFVQRMKLQSVNFNINMSDIFYVSSIKRERGTTYPFARRMEMSIGLIF